VAAGLIDLRIQTIDQRACAGAAEIRAAAVACMTHCRNKQLLNITPFAGLSPIARRSTARIVAGA